MCTQAGPRAPPARVQAAPAASAGAPAAPDPPSSGLGIAAI
ncbi:hypothetical protein GLA29479_1683 [Lysobacter antibioticus]|nr:hypothetical protein GLA29479_1683 [Lysobacter antibioticus]